MSRAQSVGWGFLRDGLDSRVFGLEFRVWGLWFRVTGSG